MKPIMRNAAPTQGSAKANLLNADSLEKLTPPALSLKRRTSHGRNHGPDRAQPPQLSQRPKVL
jgi:hypothetical protein